MKNENSVIVGDCLNPMTTVIKLIVTAEWTENNKYFFWKYARDLKIRIIGKNVKLLKLCK